MAAITVTSSEGLPVNLDVSVSFTLDPAKVPAVYTKYRNDISVIAHNFIRQTIRDRAESRAEGRAEGKVEGRVEGLAEAVVATLLACGVPASSAERERILGERDAARLGRWIARAVRCSSIAELLSEP